jgi:hypothetical protein
MYSLSKEELLELTKLVYEEASVGYLDLKESACERILNKFLEKKTLMVTTTLNMQPTTITVGGSLAFLNDNTINFPN